MKTFFAARQALLEEACPIATKDLEINIKNRQHAIDEYVYGPANPKEPGDFWGRIGKVWGISDKEASTMRCGNCAAFNVSDRIKNCISTNIGDGKEDGEAVLDLAELGYCELLHFKCAGSRTCSAWLVNGPLK